MADSEGHYIFFGGLGMTAADAERLIPEGRALVFVPADSPLQHESLDDFLRRELADTGFRRPLTVVGESLGGLYAAEAAHLLKAERCVLISCPVRRREVRLPWRLGMILRADKWLPHNILTRPNALTLRFFGLRGKAGRRLYGRLYADTPLSERRRLLRFVAKWRGIGQSPKTLRIMGENDPILTRAAKSRADLLVPGGHFIRRSHAEAVREFIVTL